MLEQATDAPDPIPGWAAAERIVDPGVPEQTIEAVIAAAAQRGRRDDRPGVWWPSWDEMKESIAFLWDRTPE